MIEFVEEVSREHQRDYLKDLIRFRIVERYRHVGGALAGHYFERTIGVSINNAGLYGMAGISAAQELVEIRERLEKILETERRAITRGAMYDE